MSGVVDEKPFGTMTNWVIEYADQSLESACRLSDDLGAILLHLNPREREIIEDDLYNIIVGAGKISSFAHRNTKAFTPEWAALMTEQGHDRYVEYKDRVAGRISLDQPPKPLPLSVQQALDIFEQLNVLFANVSPKEVRGQVHIWQSMLEISKELKTIRFTQLKKLGSELAGLIDQFVVDNTISWADFISKSKTRVATVKADFVKNDVPPRLPAKE